ncbi:hypothetical protein COT02_01780 [Candidatus Roizmanbacteria bacterium CG07_land_8_20_14_0_80_34_15]|uniref:Chorismate mutase domain-containing protein n=3 Tax=Candidatus Roizmaniibacteriota TaxID=1752723 RepID=A0A2M6YUU8_9BACT|nr:MAG: hypothetical protein COT02_01780 [Candidatus Roizmanbacteria bacterium CG07_land_8_20_14_0_80_34_15]
MNNKLKDFRKQIDEIDEQIVNLLAKRMQVVEKVGQYKKENNLPPLDNSRWQKVIESKKGFMKKIWKIIHDEALKVEKQIL